MYTTSPVECLSWPTCSAIPARIETKSRILRSSSSIRSRRLSSDGFSASVFLAGRDIRGKWLTDRTRVFNGRPRQERIAHRGELALARAAQFQGPKLAQAFQVPFYREAEIVRGFGGRGVRTARGFRDNLVDDPEFQQVRGRDFHRRGGPGDILLSRLAPQNRRAALRRDHRVARVLLHQHHVTDSDRERATGAAFADNATDDRHFQPRHQFEVVRDRFVLSAFFGAQSVVGSLSIDESDDWQPETIGQFEHATGLAIAFRPRTAEVALDTICGALAALMPHDGDLMLAEVAEPRHDRAVIGEAPIAVKLDEVADQRINVIERLRAERIARQPHALDRAEALAGG